MRKQRVLIAEDNTGHARLLHSALTNSCPYLDIKTVCTGEQFKQDIAKGNYDCAILDYNLPDGQADEILDTIQSNVVQCPVLVISSMEQLDVALSSIRNGSADFIPKSEAIKPGVLWKRLEQAIQNNRKKRIEYHRMQRQEYKLSQLSQTDSLTGLYNRNFLDDQIKNKLFQRDRRRWLSCVLIDIDRFDVLEEQFGDDGASLIVKSVAHTIKEQLSERDMAYRWGGEEFLVLLSSTSLFAAWTWAEHLLKHVTHSRCQVDHQALQLTLSIGLVNIPTEMLSYETIDLAEQARDYARQQGGSQVTTWNMVVVNEALDYVGRLGKESLSERRNEFMKYCGTMLSETQKLHVTAHCEQVEMLSWRLGEAMGLSRINRLRAKQAGLLHDIGKCLIPDELLTCNGPLTTAQWDIMNRANTYSAQISKRIGVDDQVVDYITQFKAFYNNGATVPMVSRLVNVADALSSLISKRAYRAALTVNQALAELRCESGSRYDPRLVALAHFMEPL